MVFIDFDKALLSYFAILFLFAPPTLSTVKAAISIDEFSPKAGNDVSALAVAAVLVLLGSNDFYENFWSSLHASPPPNGESLSWSSSSWSS